MSYFLIFSYNPSVFALAAPLEILALSFVFCYIYDSQEVDLVSKLKSIFQSWVSLGMMELYQRKQVSRRLKLPPAREGRPKKKEISRIEQTRADFSAGFRSICPYFPGEQLDIE